MRVLLSWLANSESNISGYKIYAGNSTGNYDDPLSPKDMGNVLSGYYTFTTRGTKYMALTAYNNVSQESGFSAEISFTTAAPTATSGRISGLGRR